MSQPEPPGCLVGWMFGLFARSPQPVEAEVPAYPYELNTDLFTKAERILYHHLRQAVGLDYQLFGKVRLGDLLEIKREAGSRQGHRNRIDRKHVDFLLCDPATLRPLLAIELDDASHQRPDRRERDEFLERALAAAELPLLRLGIRPGYDEEELRRRIDDFLDVGAD
jgi:very-short-patch-repair endonuclease